MKLEVFIAPQITLIILNEVEARDISGHEDHENSLAYFKNQFPQLRVMLTLGKRGCVYQYRE